MISPIGRFVDSLRFGGAVRPKTDAVVGIVWTGRTDAGTAGIVRAFFLHSHIRKTAGTPCPMPDTAIGSDSVFRFATDEEIVLEREALRRVLISVITSLVRDRPRFPAPLFRIRSGYLRLFGAFLFYVTLAFLPLPFHGNVEQRKARVRSVFFRGQYRSSGRDTFHNPITVKIPSSGIGALPCA